MSQSVLASIPVQEPRRLVLVPLKCFYCNQSDAEEIQQWRISHLFGLFHCDKHADAAKRDCEDFMRIHGLVRRCDARNHPTIGPFMDALGETIPVLRSSGAVDTNWHFPYIDEIPDIKYSKTTNVWGFNLTNGFADKFVPLKDFRDPRIAPFLKQEARDTLEAVEAALTTGLYDM